MDKYVYILVGIIWLVSNLYKSFQKKETDKKSTADPESPSDKKEGSVQTMLEEILTGKQHPSEPIAQEAFPVKLEKPQKKVRAVHLKETMMGETTGRENKNNSFDYDKPLVPPNEVKNTLQSPIPSEITDEETTFDLKNAIIYSEIMGKPKSLSDF